MGRNLSKQGDHMQVIPEGVCAIHLSARILHGVGLLVWYLDMEMLVDLVLI